MIFFKYKKVSIVISLIFILFFITPFTLMNNVNALYSDDIDFTFENDVLFNSQNSTLSRFNLRNESYYNGVFNGTYSFENDVIGQKPSNFTVIEQEGFVRVINGINYHNNTLRMFDNGSIQTVQIYQYFYKNQENGTIEFYFMINATTKDYYWNLYDNLNNIVIRTRINAGTLEYHDTIWNTILVLIANIWYHIRIDYECTSNGYKGLSADTWQIYINSVLYGAYNFENNANRDNLKYIYFALKSTDTDYILYLDAIGYNWKNNYEIGNNYLSNEVVLNTWEVDKFQFAYEGFNNPYDAGDNNPSGWSDVETGNGISYIYTDIGYNQTNTGIYMFDCSSVSSGTAGTQKDFDVNGNIINISFVFDLAYVFYDYIDFKIYSKDDTLLVHFRINSTLSIEYYDGSNWNLLYNYIIFDKWYQVNILINYNIDMCYLDLYLSQYLKASVEIPLFATNKDGLGIISCIGDFDYVDNIFLLDSIGVIVDGDSLSKEELFGYAYYQCNSSYSSSRFHNLIIINATGNFSIGSVSDSYEIGESYVKYLDFQYFNGIETFYNTYNSTTSVVSNPNLIFTIPSNISFNLSFYLNIEGVLFTDGINDYSLTFEYANVNINNSYFYVDDYNRLRYTLFIDDNTSLEYLQATFDINDVSTTNRSSRVVLKQNRNEPYQEYRIYFLDSTYYYVIANDREQIFNDILSQAKTITKLVFLATDNNESYESNNLTFSGYFYDISLLYFPNVDVSISILSFLAIIPPIMIIVITPLIIVLRTKLRFLFIPLIMFMSIIAFVTSVIPLWLAFIINISCILYYFIKRKYSD